MPKPKMSITLSPESILRLDTEDELNLDDITLELAQKIIKRIWGDRAFIIVFSNHVDIGEIIQGVYVKHGQGHDFQTALQNVDDWRSYLNAKYR